MLEHRSLWNMEGLRPDGRESSPDRKPDRIQDAGFAGCGVRFADDAVVAEVTSTLREPGPKAEGRDPAAVGPDRDAGARSRGLGDERRERVSCPGDAMLLRMRPQSSPFACPWPSQEIRLPIQSGRKRGAMFPTSSQ